MFAKIARTVLILAPALALAGCGSSADEPLAGGNAGPADEAAAHQTAESNAAPNQAKADDAALDAFYADAGTSDDDMGSDDHAQNDQGEPPGDDIPDAPQAGG